LDWLLVATVIDVVSGGSGKEINIGMSKFDRKSRKRSASKIKIMKMMKM
jgi:hypothetical protein